MSPINCRMHPNVWTQLYANAFKRHSEPLEPTSPAVARLSILPDCFMPLALWPSPVWPVMALCLLTDGKWCIVCAKSCNLKCWQMLTRYFESYVFFDRILNLVAFQPFVTYLNRLVLVNKVFRVICIDQLNIKSLSLSDGVSKKWQTCFDIPNRVFIHYLHMYEVQNYLATICDIG